ncbi:MAG: 16S rRNA (uracil(1498)-N(3))-methyltransferase [Spirosomataceae bacterium]
MHLFYQPNFLNVIALTDDEAFHAAKVLRLREGAQISITDGVGNWFEAILKQSNPKRCEVVIQKQTTHPPKPYSIEIALAPTKNIDRMEWFVEKATEIGIDKISFFYTQRSERKALKLERLQKIAISAMKQSLQTYLPTIIEIDDFAKFLISANPTTQKFIAHLPESTPPASLLDVALPQRNYTVLIGPEGDFTTSEIQLTQQYDFQMITLGTTRLRTETAALVACHTLHLANLHP